MTEQITLLYVPSRAMGYGRAGCDLAQDLAEQGVTVYDDLGTPPEDFTLNEGDKKVAQGRLASASPTAAVCWVSVPTHARWWWKGQHASVLTMWEASFLPEAFRDTLHEFDQIIVPSEHNVELFSRYHDNVSYLPLGVRAEQWNYVPRQAPESVFRFLHAGSGSRKGPDVAYKAFRTIFQGMWDSNHQWTGTGPEPWLVMKNPKGEEWYGNNIEMVSGRLSDAEEVALYESCHAMVMPSRGEGFGLQPLQAIAQGIPTILTDAHGHHGFADLGIPIGWDWADADYFIYGDAGQWWEPRFDEICEAMWDVYQRYDYHEGRAVASAVIVAADWTSSRTAEKFRDLLAPHLTEPLLPASPGYMVPYQKRYLVRVNQPWKADIVNEQFFWKPGQDYWELADVKRILFEAGVLDPSCLQQYVIGQETGAMDIGLTPAQLERIPDYSAAHAHCMTCGQRLNSQPTKADDILAEMEAEEVVRGEWLDPAMAAALTRPCL